MSYLIFCSFEVGGLPYKIAEILNRHGIEAYYISLAESLSDHNSTLFHYGNRKESWDISNIFKDIYTSTREIRRSLIRVKEKYKIDHCFATGSKAYLLKQAGINYKYWSYGSDLDQQCFAPILEPDNTIRKAGYPLWKKYYLHLYFYLHFLIETRSKQRKSMRYADAVMISPYQMEAYKKICSSKKLFFLPHFLKVEDFDKLLKRRTENKKKICGEIGASNYLFSSVRHVWSGYLSDESDNKGNDIMLKLFAEYLKLPDTKDIKLVLIEKGPDVEASKLLSKELGIDKQIVWMNEMKREQLDEYYQGASICFGQFGTPVLTFAAIEPIANASPCISFFGDRNLDVPFYAENPPVLNSKDPAVISSFIARLMTDDSYYADFSYRSWRWVKDNCSEEKFIEVFTKIFEQ